MLENRILSYHITILYKIENVIAQSVRECNVTQVNNNNNTEETMTWWLVCFYLYLQGLDLIPSCAVEFACSLRALRFLLDALVFFSSLKILLLSNWHL